MARAYMLLALDAASDADRLLVADFEAQRSGSKVVRWPDLIETLMQRLVALGVPPGGAKASLLTLEDGSPWYVAFDPPESGEWTPLPAGGARETIRRRYRLELVRSVADALFGGAGRDSEATLVAHVDVELAQEVGDQERQAVQAALRLLLRAGRWEPLAHSDAAALPRDVTNYLDRLQKATNLLPEDLGRLLVESIGLSSPGAPAPLAALDSKPKTATTRRQGLAVRTVRHSPPAPVSRCLRAPAVRRRDEGGVARRADR